MISSKRNDLLSWSLTAFICLLALSGIAQNPIDLTKANGNLINNHIIVYHTPDELTGKNAWKHIQRGELPLTAFNLNPGMAFPLDSYWILFKLNNTSDIENFYLEIDYPQMDFIELFTIDDARVSKLHTTGDDFSFKKRPIKTRNFVLPIELESGSTETYLLHLQKFNSTVRFPMYIHTEDSYTSRHFNSNLGYSIYFGFILLIAIVALALGFIVNVQTFKIYAFYILTFGFWLFTRLGYSYQFFFSEAIEFNRHVLSAAGQLAMMSLIVYVQSFFNTKKTLPRFHKVMNFMLGFFVLGATTWIIFPEEFVSYATKLFVIRYTLFSTIIIFAITASINYRKVELFRSNMFLLAYSLFLSAIIGKILVDYGVFSESLLQFDPIMFGFFVEVIVLSMAMGILLKRTLQKSKSIENEHEKLKENLSSKEELERSGYIKLNSKAVISIDTISHIKADDHYLELYLTNGKKEIDRNTITQISKILPNNFIQSHRSHVINLNQVKALYADKMVMKNEDTVKLSRTYKQKFKDQLSTFQ